MSMGDLISRQNAINAWDKLSKRGRTEFDQVLMTLPSAEPKTKCIAQIRINRDDMENLVNEIVEKIAEPKTGEWVEIENGEYLCSNCSHITIGYPPSYCPNCGARMKGGAE